MSMAAANQVGSGQVGQVGQVAPTMSSLPSELAAVITNSIKHDPIYELRFIHVHTHLDDDEDLDTTTVDRTKLVVLREVHGEAPMHFPYAASGPDSNRAFSKILCSHELPAQIQVGPVSHSSTTFLTETYLKPGRTFLMNPVEADTVIIISFKRFA